MSELLQIQKALAEDFNKTMLQMRGQLTALQKTDLTLGDLTTAGVLKPQQAQTFLRILIDQSKLLPLTTFLPMNSPTLEVDKIRFGSRILRAGQEATALPVADRSKPDTSKVDLIAKLYKGEVRLSNEILEDSIERGQLRQTIMQLMAERISLDVEEATIRSDTASADLFFAQQDGVLKQAVTNIVDAQSQFTNKTIWRDMLKTMPTEFFENKSALRFITSNDSEIDYRDSLSDRATPGSDAFLMEDRPSMYQGTPVVGIPVFPENLGGGLNLTQALLTDPKNIYIGFFREIRIETDKDVSAGSVIIVPSVRFAIKFAHEPAVVKAINVKVKS